MEKVRKQFADAKTLANQFQDGLVKCAAALVNVVKAQQKAMDPKARQRHAAEYARELEEIKRRSSYISHNITADGASHPSLVEVEELRNGGFVDGSMTTIMDLPWRWAGHVAITTWAQNPKVMLILWAFGSQCRDNPDPAHCKVQLPMLKQDARGETGDMFWHALGRASCHVPSKRRTLTRRLIKITSSWR